MCCRCCMAHLYFIEDPLGIFTVYNATYIVFANAIFNFVVVSHVSCNDALVAPRCRFTFCLVITHPVPRQQHLCCSNVSCSYFWCHVISFLFEDLSQDRGLVGMFITVGMRIS